MRPLGSGVNVFGINAVFGNPPILSSVPFVLGPGCGGLPMTELYNPASSAAAGPDSGIISGLGLVAPLADVLATKTLGLRRDIDKGIWRSLVSGVEISTVTVGFRRGVDELGCPSVVAVSTVDVSLVVRCNA